MFRSIAALCLICFVSVLGSDAKIPEISDRVVNGEEASILDFPYQVSLQNYDFHFCGGSILNERYVLTAAHCLEKRKPGDVTGLTVRMGTSKWMNGGVVRQVEASWSHPKYDMDSVVNDVALLKLASPLVISSAIQPIALTDKQPADGTPCVVSGWGLVDSQITVFSHTLQKGEVLFQSKEVCASSKYSYSTDIMDSMVCGDGDGTDSCTGDSGGPLVDLLTGEQVGIVSWGTSCGEKGHPGVYSNVAEMKPWIMSVMKSN